MIPLIANLDALYATTSVWAATVSTNAMESRKSLTFFTSTGRCSDEPAPSTLFDHLKRSILEAEEGSVNVDREDLVE